MRLQLFAASAALLALGACATDRETAASVSDAAMPAGASAAAPRTATAYAAQAAIADSYEIQAGQLAEQKGASEHVRQLGAKLVKDHTQTTAALKSVLSREPTSVQLPNGVDARRQAMLDALKGASGAEFDRLFLEQQKTAHEEALALHSSYAKDGDNVSLKAVAAGAAPVIQQHLTMLEHGTH